MRYAVECLCPLGPLGDAGVRVRPSASWLCPCAARYGPVPSLSLHPRALLPAPVLRRGDVPGAHFANPWAPLQRAPHLGGRRSDACRCGGTLRPAGRPPEGRARGPAALSQCVGLPSRGARPSGRVESVHLGIRNPPTRRPPQSQVLSPRHDRLAPGRPLLVCPACGRLTGPAVRAGPSPATLALGARAPAGARVGVGSAGALSSRARCSCIACGASRLLRPSAPPRRDDRLRGRGPTEV